MNIWQHEQGMHLFLTWVLVIGFGFDDAFGYFDDRSAFYLPKLIIERSVGTGGLLPESISEITVIVFYFRDFPNIGFTLSAGFPISFFSFIVVVFVEVLDFWL